jgi:hypothetical protein
VTDRRGTECYYGDLPPAPVHGHHEGSAPCIVGSVDVERVLVHLDQVAGGARWGRRGSTPDHMGLAMLGGQDEARVAPSGGHVCRWTPPPRHLSLVLLSSAWSAFLCTLARFPDWENLTALTALHTTPCTHAESVPRRSPECGSPGRGPGRWRPPQRRHPASRPRSPYRLSTPCIFGYSAIQSSSDWPFLSSPPPYQLSMCAHRAQCPCFSRYYQPNALQCVLMSCVGVTLGLSSSHTSTVGGFTLLATNSGFDE